LYAEEDGVSTPLGDIMMDGELRDALRREIPGGPDRYRDNTVEVQLPMIRYFFPRARLLWIRLPAEPASFEAGSCLARLGESLKRNLVVLGSTDLTHYGYNYDFYPRGTGKEALEWSRANDAAFIGAVRRGDPREVLDRAEGDRSACSAGAVLGALGFARAVNASGAELLAYGTSAGIAGTDVPDSFVGYAGLAWFPAKKDG
jgi:AmmeMemoRadiSam system protein B